MTLTSALDCTVPMFGFYNINKPVGPTSHDIVAGLRRRLGRGVRVGHAGTLDPFAGGVLVLCVGPATRLADVVQASTKRYVAEITLGATSTTDDIEGDLTFLEDAAAPSAADVQRALGAMIGTIPQRPPAYSAVHHGGERAYARARRGDAVDLPPREVTIHELVMLDYSWPHVRVQIRCGTGTYIRAIARDVGAALEAGGYCSELTRTAVGSFTIEDAVSPDSLEPEDHLLKPLAALPHLPRAVLADAAVIDLVHGKVLRAGQFNVIGAASRPDTTAIALVSGTGNLLAIGEFRPGAETIQPHKVFVTPP